jgi:hypothetical protein
VGQINIRIDIEFSTIPAVKVFMLLRKRRDDRSMMERRGRKL